MSNPEQYRRRWLIRAPLGLSLMGFGACLIAEAAMKKYAGAATLEWGMWGTVALVVFNSGASFLGDAVLQRARYERALEKNKQT